ncbi:MAG TPA: hypothetical protein DDY72_00335 [Verrucomicrobia bacterium]|nr:hypothetical protein [Verrucomicrobiota bacterium]
MSRANVQSAAASVMQPAQTGVLMGRYEHALDPKKRFTIPSEWRAAMGNPDYVYVMPDPASRCLNLIPKAEMEVRLEKLREKALFDPALNEALQTIGANAEQLPLDTQGRIRVSDKFLAFAHLTASVALVGAVRMIKLWDPAALPPEGAVDQAALGAALAKVAF